MNSHRFEGPAGQLHYLAGERSGKPVLVLLAGLTCHARYWDGVWQGLARDHDVYALDWRGHGDSAHAESYGFGDYQADLEAFLAHVGAPDALLVGHSLGGYVALRYAAEHAVRGVVACDVKTGITPEELEGGRKHFEAHERCLFCDIVAQERRDGARVIAENDDAIALAPWAARSPFETWVLPRRHHSHFEELPRAQLRGVASLLRQTLRRIDVALEKPPYNLMLHTAPLREPELPHYHWHFEILPALAQVAGFEWGSGFHINPTPPEEAAAFLRKLEV